MRTKGILEQKTTWAGASLIAFGAYQLITGTAPADGLQQIITGLGMIFMRQAIKNGD